jgi:hypothetical protein
MESVAEQLGICVAVRTVPEQVACMVEGDKIRDDGRDSRA